MDNDGVYMKKGNLGGARHGDAYQVKFLIMLSERAASNMYGISDDFQLGTELNPSANSFDDAVLRHTQNNEDHWLFGQVKFKHNKMYIEERNLFPVDGKGDFSICQYLEAFCNNMKDQFKGYKKFVIFTNCGLAKSVKNLFIDGSNEIDSVLKVQTNGVHFMKLKPNRIVFAKLSVVNSNFIKLAEILRSTLINGEGTLETADGNFIKTYRPAIAYQILVPDTKMKGSVRFSPRFINNKNLNRAELILRGQLFPENASIQQCSSCVQNTDLYQILTTKQGLFATLPVFVEKAEMEEFLNSLIFAFDQPDNVGLKEIIINELKWRYKPSVPGLDADARLAYATLAYSSLEQKIGDCLDAKKGLAICKKDLVKIWQNVEKIMECQVKNFAAIIFRDKIALFQGFEFKLTDLTDNVVLGQVVQDDFLNKKLLQDSIFTIGPTLPELETKRYISRKITHLNTTKTSGGSTYNEETFIDHLQKVVDKVVVLSSTAGMGKTTLCKKLAILAKSRFQTKWVFYLCKKHLINSTIAIDAIDFLQKQFRLSQLDELLLRREFEKLERVYLFVDGFESMDSASLKLCELQKSIQLIMMSTHTSMKLEETFNVDSFSLEPLSMSDALAHLKYLCDVMDEDVNNPLSKSFERMLEEIPKTLKLPLSEILGNPSMVDMMATVFKSEKFQKTGDLDGFNNMKPYKTDIAVRYREITRRA